MNFLKFIPLILKGKNVSDAYQAEVGQGKPIYLSRRFVGAVIVLIGAGASMYFGVSLDENILLSLTDNAVSAISAVVALYGAVLGVIGIFFKKK